MYNFLYIFSGIARTIISGFFGLAKFGYFCVVIYGYSRQCDVHFYMFPTNFDNVSHMNLIVKVPENFYAITIKICLPLESFILGPLPFIELFPRPFTILANIMISI